MTMQSVSLARKTQSYLPETKVEKFQSKGTDGNEETICNNV